MTNLGNIDTVDQTSILEYNTLDICGFAVDARDWQLQIMHSHRNRGDFVGRVSNRKRWSEPSPC